MKRIFILLAVSLAVLLHNPAKAQDVKPQKDTISLNFLEKIDKGDILPFKYFYQRAKIWEDTLITCSVQSDFEFEAVENKKDEGYVAFDIYRTNFEKSGEEANDAANIHTTCLINDGLPLRMLVSYSGSAAFDNVPDTLLARAERNIRYIADTLSGGSIENRDAFMEHLGFMKDYNFAFTQALSGYDLARMFFFFRWKYISDEVYTTTDSTYNSWKDEWLTYPINFVWDNKFSEEVKGYDDLYVLRSSFSITGANSLMFMGISPYEEDTQKLLESVNKERLFHTNEATMLVDRSTGLPLVLDIRTINGFYERLDDEHISVERVTLSIDLEKLIGSDEDEDEDYEEPLYDSYGIIRVK